MQDQLIKESLLCLHFSLEAVRVQSSCTLTKAAHQACCSSSCKIDCLSRLDAKLKTYLNLLSKVLFKKNSKNCRDWWLSVFYSLCIQSYVRKSLITFVSHQGQGENAKKMTTSSTTSQYLYLAVELFAACNDTGKKYDPLSYNLDKLSKSEASVIEIHSLNFEQAKLAQIAVQQTSWGQKHISGSYAYLREQFEAQGSACIPPVSRKLEDREMVDHCSPNSNHSMQEIELQGRPKNAPFHSPSPVEQSREDVILGYSPDTDLEDSHALGLLHNGTEVSPPAEDLNLLDDLRNTRENNPRFEGDLYTPQWIRDFKLEGWCGLCKPGRWINMNKAWWNDRVLFHGICAETGKPFPEPEVELEVDADKQIWKGQCGKCNIEVTFKKGDMRHYSAWHVHSANVSMILSKTEILLT